MIIRGFLGNLGSLGSTPQSSVQVWAGTASSACKVLMEIIGDLFSREEHNLAAEIATDMRIFDPSASGLRNVTAIG